MVDDTIVTKTWEAPVVEELHISSATEGMPGDDGYGGDDFISS